MNAANAINVSSQVREAILDAAETRLLRFGYHKTTMAEIAEDAGMSAANLYRYFANKKDIVAECAARCIDERLERLRRVVRDRTLAPPDKLAQYAHELVADSHETAGADSMVGEIVDTITRERPDLLHSRNDIHHALLADILREGVARGDFAVADIEGTAVMIFSAFALFDVPLFVGLFDRDEFDRRAAGVVTLILDGLTPR